MTTEATADQQQPMTTTHGGTDTALKPDDEEARLREILSKKKIIQKQTRRKNSGADHAATAAAGGDTGRDDNPNKTSSPAKEDEGRDQSDKKTGEDPRKSAPVAGSGGKDEKGANANRRSRRRRRRNRGARGAARGGGGRGGGQPLPDSRSYYGGGSDYRGPPGPGYYGDRGGGGWDRRYHGPSYDRGGGYYGGGGGPDDRYWDDRGRGGNRGGASWRDSRDPYGPPRGGGRGRSPLGGKERGRSRTRSHSRSFSRSRSFSSASSRSHSSTSRSYSSRSRSRSYSSASRSRSRSYSRSPSRSRSASPADKNRKRGRSLSAEGRVKRCSKSPDGKQRNGGKSRSRSPSPGEGSSEQKRQRSEEKEPDALTKDQRTVFVSQLVMRADERDIRRYFKKKIGAKVRDVILLRDKRTGRHKGCAYVELGNLEDVVHALNASGQNPDFQRFPLLIKRTEAEKNYADGLGLGLGVGGEQGIAMAYGNTAQAPPVQLTADGRRIEAQKVYVGTLDQCVTQAQLYALFSQFGPLDKVLLQMDAATGISRGFAFLSFRDPKDANLAIQTMSGQLIAGKPLKMGWANQQSSVSGVEEVRSDKFPDDANEKVQKANLILTQLTGSGLVTILPQVAPSQQALLAGGTAGALGALPTAQLASVAEAALDMALGETPSIPVQQPAVSAAPVAAAIVDAKVVGRSENPSANILVHNMFDKDEETEEGWEEEIKLDFEEECSQYGKIVHVLVMSKDPGGKIYASFDSIESASNCAKALAGRWFDKRQLRVEFVTSIPDSS